MSQTTPVSAESFRREVSHYAFLTRLFGTTRHPAARKRVEVLWRAQYQRILSLLPHIQLVD
jgi:hypothetical protein